MQIEDPKFVAVNAVAGVVCALFQTSLVTVLLVCATVALLSLPAFALSHVNGFWASYHPSNFKAIRGLLFWRSGKPYDRAWAVFFAMVLLACGAGIFGLVMCEAVLPRVSGFEAAGRPFGPVAITMLGLYALYRGLTWWVRKSQGAR